MSEYQYYEFCSISKRLTKEARDEMESLSSRANVGTHTASYVYNYGDFYGDSDELLLKHFDVFFYISNFGNIRLTFKYKITEIDFEEIKKYCIEDSIECEQHGQNILLEVNIQNEGGFGWTEGEGLLADLLPLYDEIKDKNYQFLRIVAAVHNEFYSEDENEKSLSAFISEIPLISEAQQTFLECAAVEY